MTALSMRRNTRQVVSSVLCKHGVGSSLLKSRCLSVLGDLIWHLCTLFLHARVVFPGCSWIIPCPDWNLEWGNSVFPLRSFLAGYQADSSEISFSSSACSSSYLIPTLCLLFQEEKLYQTQNDARNRANTLLPVLPSRDNDHPFRGQLASQLQCKKCSFKVWNSIHKAVTF